MNSISTQQDSETSRKYRLRWWTLIVLSLSLVLIAVDTTILNVAIPTLQRDLGASASGLQWIVSSYILVFAGLLCWTFFSNAVSQSGSSLVNQSHLLTKIYFPRLLVPAASIGVGLIDFALNFAVFGGLMLWYRHVPGPAILLLPLMILIWKPFGPDRSRAA